MTNPRLAACASSVFALANSEAIKLCHTSISTNHILLGLATEESGVAALIMNKVGTDRKCLQSAVLSLLKPGSGPAASGVLPMAPEAKQVIQFGLSEATRLGDSHFGSEHLLFGLIKEEDGAPALLLKEFGVTLFELNEFLSQHRQANSNAKALSTPQTAQQPSQKTSALRNFGHKIAVVREDHLEVPTVGRQKEIDALNSLLSARQNPRALLIGKTGAGKLSIVRGLVRDIGSGRFPQLAGYTAYEINLDHLLAGTKFQGALEERFWALEREILRTRTIAVMRLFPARGSIDYALKVARFLNIATFPFVAIATKQAWQMWVDLAEPLHIAGILTIEEPDSSLSRLILTSAVSLLESHYRVSIQSEAIDEALLGAATVKSERPLFLSALETLERACTFITHRPASLDEIALRSEIADLSATKDSLVKQAVEENDSSLSTTLYERAADIYDQIKTKRKHLDSISDQISDGRAVVDSNVIRDLTC